jgi:hypothetical protein
MMLAVAVIPLPIIAGADPLRVPLVAVTVHCAGTWPATFAVTFVIE